MKTLAIGNLVFQRPLLMGPMEGITDAPFRKTVRKHGCGIICTQMIHADGLLKGNQSRMHEVTVMLPKEQPVGMQLCGSEPEIVGEASKKAQDMGAAFIDLNMGCPAKNVVGRGAGAALLQDPKKSALMIRTMVSSVTIPVTIKIRAGWDAGYLGGLDIAKIAEEEGVKLVSIHARTRSQKFKGHADWDLIREVKSRIQIPVVGNGDVFVPEDIPEMLASTGADGVMVARGALGNPWIFSQTRPTVANIRETLFEHMEDHLSFYPSADVATVTFRKHIVWYTKGLSNSAEFRVRVFKEKDPKIVEAMLNDYFDSLDPNFVRPIEGVNHESSAT